MVCRRVSALERFIYPGVRRLKLVCFFLHKPHRCCALHFFFFFVRCRHSAGCCEAGPAATDLRQVRGVGQGRRGHLHNGERCVVFCEIENEIAGIFFSPDDLFIEHTPVYNRKKKKRPRWSLRCLFLIAIISFATCAAPVSFCFPPPDMEC